MGTGQSAFADFAHIQISQFDFLVILGQEDVGTLDISVKNVHPMESLESVQHLNGHFPDLAFRDHLLALLEILDVSGKVPSSCKLSDEQETVRGIVVDGVFVADNVGIVDGCQYSDFVEGVLHVFVTATGQFDLLHGVDLSVFFPFDLIDNSEGSFADLANSFEILHFVN